MKIFHAFNLVVFQINLLLHVSCFSILQLRRNCQICGNTEASLGRRSAALILQSSLRTEDSITNSTAILNKERDSLNSDLESGSTEKSISESAYNDVKNIFDGLSVFEDLHDVLEGDISELDIEYAGEESLLDVSIAKAVKQMLDDGPKEPEPSPVEKFQNLYKDIKSKNNSVPLDSASMLKMLFEGGEEKDPFDERKVMIKLRNMLAPEDFKDLFLDPTVGEW